MPKQPPFAKETDLCAAFLEALDKRAWTAYPETAHWDILLVRKDDGFQIGVEAKLRLNIDVINQAIEEYSAWHATSPGPDCRAVLVPEGTSGGYQRVCNYIGITIIRVEAVPRVRGRRTFMPRLPEIGDKYSEEYWHEWAPTKRHPLPEYVPDVKAGVPSPLTLTQWKIGALKLQILIERNGHLTRQDFKTCGVDHRRWLARENEWLVRDGVRLVKGPKFPEFAKQHPVVYEQIKADMAAATQQPELI